MGRIFALYKLLETRVDRVLKPLGVPLWGFDVLFALRRVGTPFTLMPTQLMKSCFLTSGAMTHRLDRLESQGFIKRSHDTEDRRSVKITLTPAGVELVERALPVRVESMSELLSGFSPQERETLAGLLRKLLIQVEAAEGF